MKIKNKKNNQEKTSGNFQSLSDKREILDYNKDGEMYAYYEEDVRDFIKKLKEIDFEGYFPEKIIEEIDKLAGGDLR